MKKTVTISGVHTQEISVVLQGPINDITPRSIASIRTHLPGAEIILSTWEGSDLAGLDYDELALSKDPGAPPLDMVRPLFNNGNRQLVSTQAGLKKARRQYALKLRTDFHLEGNSFLEHWDSYPKSVPDYTLFKHKVIINSVFTKEYCGVDKTPEPFHYSDFWHFGLTEDIKDFFLLTPPSPAEDLFDPNRTYLYPNKIPAKDRYLRYAPEQYYAYSWAKRHLGNAVEFADVTDCNPKNVEISKQILYNNFIILSPRESGIMSSKYNAIMYQEQDFEPGIVSHTLFLKKYQQYCDNSFVINKIEIFNEEEGNEEKVRVSLKKHFNAFLSPVKKTMRWVGEPFSLLYYAILYLSHKLRRG